MAEPPPKEGSFEPQLLHSFLPRGNAAASSSSSSVKPVEIGPLCFPSHGGNVLVERSKPSPIGFETVLTDGEGRRSYAAILIVPRRLEKNRNWWTSLALCVVSRHSLLLQHRAFLAHLFRISKSRNAPCRLESFIATYCRDSPAPPRGLCRVLVTLGDAALWLALPPPNELPHCDVANFNTLFDECLSHPNVVLVWSLLLVETRVALLSRHPHKFARASLALLSLLFPFEWRGALIPICPSDAFRHLIEAPVPFLAGGLDPNYLREVVPEHRPKGVVFVHLDNDTVHLGDVPSPMLPTRHATKLYRRLREIDANSATFAHLKSYDDDESPSSSAPTTIERSSTIDCGYLNGEYFHDDSPPEAGIVASDSPQRSRRSSASDNWTRYGITKSLDDPVHEWSSHDGVLVHDIDALPSADDQRAPFSSLNSKKSPRARHDDDEFARLTCLAARKTRARRDAFLRFVAATMLGYRSCLQPNETAAGNDTTSMLKSNQGGSRDDLQEDDNKKATTKFFSAISFGKLPRITQAIPRACCRGFDVERFLSTREVSGRQWVAALASTQMFAAFIKEANKRRVMVGVASANQSPNTRSRSDTYDDTGADTRVAVYPSRKKSDATGSPAVRTARIHLDALPLRDESATEASDALLLFDETCNAKLNRNSLKLKHHSTPFLESTNWRVTETYVVPPPSGSGGVIHEEPLLSLRADCYPRRVASRSLPATASVYDQEARRSIRNSARIAFAQFILSGDDGLPITTEETKEVVRCCKVVQSVTRMASVRRVINRAGRSAIRIQTAWRCASTRGAMIDIVTTASEALLDALFDAWTVRKELLLQRSRCIALTSSHFGAPPCLSLALRLDEATRLGKGTLCRRAKEEVTQALRPALARGGVNTLLAAATAGRIDAELDRFATMLDTQHHEVGPSPASVIRQASSSSSIRSPPARMLSPPAFFQSPPPTGSSSRQKNRKQATTSSSVASSSEATPGLPPRRFFASPQLARSGRKKIALVEPSATQLGADITNQQPASSTGRPTSLSRQQLQQFDVYEAIKTLDPAQREGYFETFGISEDKRRKRKVSRFIWQRREDVVPSARLILLCVECGLAGDADRLHTPAERHRDSRIRRALLSTSRAGLMSLQRTSTDRRTFDKRIASSQSAQ